ncbi:DUF4118 domain-containing protein [Kribbella sp. NBC_01245]|uniref:DUF4118 domain-containing protein n=1 Tax=Kribbella sp. NBC_01245 TaxID=2903578 RepID=UPI002E2B5062|nr:DUF4118 domain-containing protein [Kribbella sp. NBC_01245]
MINVAALLAPLAVCAALIPLRDDVENTNAALILVLVVVAFASSGRRPAGILAAISSAVWFDFFLTRPYQAFTINDRADIETAVLLVLTGAAVTEIALWGRRQQASASRQTGYLEGILAAGETGLTGDALIEHVTTQITDVLGLDSCRYDAGGSRGYPTLGHDGAITRGGHAINVERDGLPIHSEIEIPLQGKGRLLLVAATRISRPDRRQRLIAVALADQLATALTEHPHEPACG